MLKLWGEDAIVDFPGAKASVIEDRDAFMAKTLYSAATGGEGAAPAYVLTADGKGLAYRRGAEPPSPPRRSSS